MFWPFIFQPPHFPSKVECIFSSKSLPSPHLAGQLFSLYFLPFARLTSPCDPPPAIFRHPFSITSAPSDFKLSIHIRAVGDWTKAMIHLWKMVFKTSLQYLWLALFTIAISTTPGNSKSPNSKRNWGRKERKREKMSYSLQLSFGFGGWSLWSSCSGIWKLPSDNSCGFRVRWLLFN